MMREARRAAKITQADLAERLGTRQQFVSKFESGERRIDVVEFFDIAHALGVDPFHILAAAGVSQKNGG